ncbi:hypothetical protein JNO44_30840 [Streptomyces noursei]|nr:hypothetical protein JNO44_30840 [Streptomyces noursei]
MTFGFARPPQDPPPDADGPAARLGRLLEPAEWASAGIPLLRSPREVVAELHGRHLPGPSTVIVAVLDAQERIVASASFTGPAATPDGWEYRNALLTQLRRIIPHDLRLRVPVRTAVLLLCREGEPRWTEVDGAWMWGLRDACTLHGLRCGAFIALTRDRWQVLGEERGGRRPRTAVATKSGRGPDTARAGRDTGSGTVDAPAAPEDVVPGAAATPPGPRTAERPAGLPDRPADQGPVAPQRVPPGRTAAPGEQPRGGGRGTPRRAAGGGTPEIRRHPAAR